MFCPDCSAEIPDKTSEFCQNCGKKLCDIKDIYDIRVDSKKYSRLGFFGIMTIILNIFKKYYLYFSGFILLFIFASLIPVINTFLIMYCYAISIPFFVKMLRSYEINQELHMSDFSLKRDKLDKNLLLIFLALLFILIYTWFNVGYSEHIFVIKNELKIIIDIVFIIIVLLIPINYSFAFIRIMDKNESVFRSLYHTISLFFKNIITIILYYLIFGLLLGVFIIIPIMLRFNFLSIIPYIIVMIFGLPMLYMFTVLLYYKLNGKACLRKEEQIVEKN